MEVVNALIAGRRPRGPSRADGAATRQEPSAHACGNWGRFGSAEPNLKNLTPYGYEWRSAISLICSKDVILASSCSLSMLVSMRFGSYMDPTWILQESYMHGSHVYGPYMDPLWNPIWILYGSSIDSILGPM